MCISYNPHIFVVCYQKKKSAIKNKLIKWADFYPKFATDSYTFCIHCTHLFNKSLESCLSQGNYSGQFCQYDLCLDGSEVLRGKYILE